MYFFISNACKTNINQRKKINILLRNDIFSIKIFSKFSFFCFIILILVIYLINIEKNKSLINKNFIKNKNKFNLKFDNNIKKRINIAIYAYGIKNGGRARSSSLLINNFYKLDIFNLFLFTKIDKEKDEYKLPDNLKRIIIRNNLIKQIKRNKIKILIYQLSIHEEIKLLNNLRNIKVIFYQHLGILDWIYGNYTIFKNIYRDYIDSEYVVNIIPYENDYLFPKWGIKSIYMDNFMTYEFIKVIPSDLLSKTILMIGRGDAKKKRFEKGILAMEYIDKEIPESQMFIISDLKGIFRHESLIMNINLKDKIKFEGYTASPEIYYKNASLNLFPSISEAFPLVICETKIYGIPNILLGLDYTSISEGGSFIIYDETSESLANIAIKLLANQDNRLKLGENARNSMKKFNNNLLLIKWIKIILSIYIDDILFEILRKQDKKLSLEESLNIIGSQVKLLQIRIPLFKNITINNLESFDYMEKFNI